jgi:MFS family permease
MAAQVLYNFEKAGVFSLIDESRLQTCPLTGAAHSGPIGLASVGVYSVQTIPPAQDSRVGLLFWKPTTSPDINGQEATTLLTHDDRMLTDIGIARSNIEPALSVKWNEDPAVALSEIRRRRLQAYQQGFVRQRLHETEVALCRQRMTWHAGKTGVMRSADPFFVPFPCHRRPMRFLPFLRENARWLIAGILMTSSSSFGQTYFISLSAAHIQSAFGLNHGGWGAIYTMGTLMSAAALVQVGRLADRFRVKSLALLTIAVFVAMCLAMAIVGHWVLLVFVIFGLRFCGQGMMSHLSLTAMARWFRGNRGRAVAIASLGFSIGEGFLPIAFVLLSGLIGWRLSWVTAAAILALLVAPLLMYLLREERSPQSMSESQHTSGLADRHWTRGEAMRHWLFWALTPGILAPSFITTSLFFHQIHLADIKGWHMASFVATYPIYSAFSVIANFAAGSYADRFGAARLLPFYLLPMGAAMFVVGTTSNFWMGPLALILVGITQGSSHAMIGSIWPEYFGTRNLGAIRAFAVASSVFASAIGPGVTGFLIDQGVGFETQCLWMGGYVAAVSLIFVGVSRAAHVERYRNNEASTQ